ncbi:hypothetical protein SZ64_17935 [Erythrobacter sp. SG61-1L]|uniref:hypothetical protein n=1 Tax=Erythrobacter sp. SG61-1L TaxID=1603897 RepID=UPI0006C9249C|nr:hypothetical protein [Erythrobacter sp. SG61-1L]KPL69734.1 hypothetical protein SZ64_17510 [Erythrobacter sp. SG61-1L]KPL69813.1 hypothetical protein SZ64_17935 [Erythrobacter sp. SG61-1L]
MSLSDFSILKVGEISQLMVFGLGLRARPSLPDRAKALEIHHFLKLARLLQSLAHRRDGPPD